MVDVESWYRKYGESVYRRCLRFTRDATRARDLTQETFLRAHRYRDGFRGEASPMAWLFTIADRCFFDTCRKPEPILAEDVESFCREETEGADRIFDRQDLVARMLSRAPKDLRQIVVHRYFDELDNHQIAAKLGINEKTVRRKLEKFLVNARKFALRNR